MDQLWCIIYSFAKNPSKDRGKLSSGPDARCLGHLLRMLHSHGVDWTDPSAWPEDFVDGHWEQQIPIPFLLESCEPGKEDVLEIHEAICKGTLASTVRCCKTSAPDFAAGSHMHGSALPAQLVHF